MKTTEELLEEFLKESLPQNHQNISLFDYSIENNVIKINYYYTLKSMPVESSREYSIHSIYLIDYLTWIYNKCNQNH